jgi:fluoride exporter
MHVLLVMLGGAVGSALRYLLGTAMPVPVGTLPLPTLIVNIAGSGILGAVTALTAYHGGSTREWALLLGTGLCGGFTTFSTFSVEVLSLWDSGHGLMAAVYIVLSVSGGLLAALLGALIVRGGLPTS